MEFDMIDGISTSMICDCFRISIYVTGYILFIYKYVYPDLVEVRVCLSHLALGPGSIHMWYYMYLCF